MVSSTLFPAVHILGSQNVYSRAEGIADHYWPWAVFYKLLPNRDLGVVGAPLGMPKNSRLTPDLSLAATYQKLLLCQI